MDLYFLKNVLLHWKVFEIDGVRKKNLQMHCLSFLPGSDYSYVKEYFNCEHLK